MCSPPPPTVPDMESAERYRASWPKWHLAFRTGLAFTWRQCGGCRTEGRSTPANSQAYSRSSARPELAAPHPPRTRTAEKQRREAIPVGAMRYGTYGAAPYRTVRRSAHETRGAVPRGAGRGGARPGGQGTARPVPYRTASHHAVRSAHGAAPPVLHAVHIQASVAWSVRLQR